MQPAAPSQANQLLLHQPFAQNLRAHPTTLMLSDLPALQHSHWAHLILSHLDRLDAIVYANGGDILLDKLFLAIPTKDVHARLGIENQAVRFGASFHTVAWVEASTQFCKCACIHFRQHQVAMQYT
eukprot:213022-Chlamydomonas_euryale.AAC.2